MTRFSQLSKKELTVEIMRLEEAYQKAEQENMGFEAAVFKQKIRIARSYLIDPTHITLDRLYEIEGESGQFRVKYLNGIMAWGSWEGSWEEIAFPLAILRPIEK